MASVGLTAIVACGLLLRTAAFSAHAADLSFRCANSASHATWDLKVDPANGTVDGSPAKFGTASIAWRDTARGGNYALDRSSGELTYTNASSMGGYMLFYHCQQLK